MLERSISISKNPLIKDFHLTAVLWYYEVLHIKLKKWPDIPNKSSKAATKEEFYKNLYVLYRKVRKDKSTYP